MRREPDIAAFLAHLPLFQGLHRAEIARLAAATTRRELRRGEVLFRQADAVTGLHAVVYGRIALAASVPGKRGRLNDVVAPGESFGEAVMFLGKPYIVTAKALTDALVLHVDKAAVLAELERNPMLARRIIASLAEKLHGAIRESEARASGSAEERFAAWLVRLARTQSGAANVELPDAKKLVASRLDISAEHLSRVLRALADKGLIVVRRRNIAIPDVARLRDWHESPRT